VKTLESKETKAQRNETVTHNSVFAAHRLNAGPECFRGRHFLFLKPRITRMSRMRLAAGASATQASCLWGRRASRLPKSFDHRMAKCADRVESAYHGRIRLREKLPEPRRMGLTGLEPVTLRLSSACSNQLSYRPVRGLAPDFRISTADFQFVSWRASRAIT
jgi:hypothetical protein